MPAPPSKSPMDVHHRQTANRSTLLPAAADTPQEPPVSGLLRGHATTPARAATTVASRRASRPGRSTPRTVAQVQAIDPSTIRLHVTPLLRWGKRLARHLASVGPRVLGQRKRKRGERAEPHQDAHIRKPRLVPRTKLSTTAARGPSAPAVRAKRRVRVPCATESYSPASTISKRPTHLELPEVRRKEAKAWLLTS